MKIKKQIKINYSDSKTEFGDYVEYEGRLYICLEGKSCKGCYFFNKPCPCIETGLERHSCLGNRIFIEKEEYENTKDKIHMIENTNRRR